MKIKLTIEKFNTFTAGMILPLLIFSIPKKEFGWMAFYIMFFVGNLYFGLKESDKNE